MMSIYNTPGPAGSARPVPGRQTGGNGREDLSSGVDLGILDSLAALPVAEHLAIYEELHSQLSADLGSTSQEHG